VDRTSLIRLIKSDPAAYAGKRIAEMDRDDVTSLLKSLARTKGIKP